MDPEIIDITELDDIPVISLNEEKRSSSSSSSSYASRPSVNFGAGIELLMNDKRVASKSGGGNDNEIDLGDLDSLENELNNLSEAKSTKVASKSSLFSQAFDSGIKLNISKEDSSYDHKDSGGSDGSPSLGFATANKEGHEDMKTWDGFGKFNNIPINPDAYISDKPKMTPEELLREKFKVLRKLEDIERKGGRLTKMYTMESNLLEMQGEYEMIVAEKERSNSCKFQGRMLMAAVTGLEFLNNRFDPFDVKLDGWSEQINENIDEYDDIFAELHEKYKSKAKMAPELKLLFQLGGSAIMVHMSNTMFKSSLPGMDDIMRQNPELMQQFTQAAVNSMGTTAPGFSGFMNNFMPSAAPPPAPMPAANLRTPRSSNAPSNRPDMSRARGGEDGVSIEEQFESLGKQPPERSMRPPPQYQQQQEQQQEQWQSQMPSKPQQSQPDDSSWLPQFPPKQQQQMQQQQQQQNKRPEMKGPSDISSILSGLKTKTVNLPQPLTSSSSSSSLTPKNHSSNKDDSSNDGKRAKRKQKSDKNIVSLDI
jgi:hypothetical protein